MKQIIQYLMTLLILTSCGEFAIEEQVVGNYYLIATDVGDDCGLSYKGFDENSYGVIISATVFAIGYNERYLIAKQHPRNFPARPDKGITNYYILPMMEGFDYRTKNGLMGPMIELEFKKKRKELGVSEELTFTKVFKDLE